ERGALRLQPCHDLALGHGQTPFGHGDRGDGHLRYSCTARTAAAIRSGSGIYSFSSPGANGTGVCGAVTRRIGAFSAPNALSATSAAMSVAMLQRGVASSTMTSRPVRVTLSTIVSSSSGDVVRGSISSHSIP